MTHKISGDDPSDPNLNQTPSLTGETGRSRHKQQCDAKRDGADHDRPATAPPLTAGPGRPRILDPDQATLDANVQRLLSLAAIQATREETAAVLGVSVDTLGEFFLRYPTVKEKYDDSRLTGIASIRRQAYRNLETDPATVRWLGERIAGIRDPYKLQELDLRERALAAREKESVQTHELKMKELARRERDIRIKEQQLELKIQDLGDGPPIDISSLSLKQLYQLAARLRGVLNADSGLTYADVKSLSSPAGVKPN